LIIEEGAFFEGNCKMNSNHESWKMNLIKLNQHTQRLVLILV
jgi:cytoskeletal protein CcmA (bactofilin family)